MILDNGRSRKESLVGWSACDDRLLCRIIPQRRHQWRAVLVPPCNWRYSCYRGIILPSNHGVFTWVYNYPITVKVRIGELCQQAPHNGAALEGHILKADIGGDTMERLKKLYESRPTNPANMTREDRILNDKADRWVSRSVIVFCGILSLWLLFSPLAFGGIVMFAVLVCLFIFGEWIYRKTPT